MPVTLGIDDSNLLPDRFKPTNKRLYVLAKNGVDAFTLDSVSVDAKQSYQPIHSLTMSTSMMMMMMAGAPQQRCSMFLRNPISPSAAQDVMNDIQNSMSGNGTPVDWQIKIYDSVGCVMHSWGFYDVVITQVSYQSSMYSVPGTSVDLEFIFRELKVQF